MSTKYSSVLKISTANNAPSVIGFSPVNKAGDTMIGSLLLKGDPTANLESTTKQYVDTQVSPKISIGKSIAIAMIFGG